MPGIVVHVVLLLDRDDADAIWDAFAFSTHEEVREFIKKWRSHWSRYRMETITTSSPDAYEPPKDEDE